MILKSMDLEAIVERLRARHPNAYVAHTPENVGEVVIRLYFRAAQFRRGSQREGKVLELVRGEVLPTIIRGVPGVRTAAVVEVKRHRRTAGGGLELAAVYAVQTAGTNIYGVLAHNKVDPLRVVSSSIGDTAAVFGIAAARAAIVREVRRLMGARAPNPRHLLLYADEMTQTGRLTSLERGGVNVREPDNVFLRMAMSAPTQVLQESTLLGREGRVSGVAPYLMLGRAPRLGTTWNGFAVDPGFVRAHTKTVDDVLAGLGRRPGPDPGAGPQADGR